MTAIKNIILKTSEEEFKVIRQKIEAVTKNVNEDIKKSESKMMETIKESDKKSESRMDGMK